MQSIQTFVNLTAFLKAFVNMLFGKEMSYLYMLSGQNSRNPIASYQRMCFSLPSRYQNNRFLFMGPFLSSLA